MSKTVYEDGLVLGGFVKNYERKYIGNVIYKEDYKKYKILTSRDIINDYYYNNHSNHLIYPHPPSPASYPGSVSLRRTSATAPAKFLKTSTGWRCKACMYV